MSQRANGVRKQGLVDMCGAPTHIVHIFVNTSASPIKLGKRTLHSDIKLVPCWIMSLLKNARARSRTAEDSISFKAACVASGGNCQMFHALYIKVFTPPAKLKIKALSAGKDQCELPLRSQVLRI